MLEILKTVITIDQVDDTQSTDKQVKEQPHWVKEEILLILIDNEWSDNPFIAQSYLAE